MNFLQQIQEIDKIVDARKEEEYRKTLFDTASATSAGLGFAGSYIVNGQPFNVTGENGSYNVNGEPFSIIGGGY